MRYWRIVLLCLAVVLPWRSAMAVTMVMAPMSQHSAPALIEQAPCPHAAGNLGHSDMAEHTSCDVCHSQALSADVRTLSTAHPHPTSTPHPSERFASVVPALGHKPPISA